MSDGQCDCFHEFQISDMYSETCQISKIDLFEKIYCIFYKYQKNYAIFAGSSICDV